MADQNLNLKQIYDQNPITSIPHDALMYFDVEPYDAESDAAALAKDAYPSLTNVVYASKGGDNTNNNGTEAFPYADPYAANTAITGTSANPKKINVSPGTYSTTNFALKPHTTIDAKADVIFSLSGNLTLDASWSSETSAKFYCYNAYISGTTNLDFTSTGAAFNIAKFYNTVFGGAATFSDDAQGNEFQFWNCEFTAATFKSTVPRINKCQFSSTFTVEPSAGTGNTTLFVRNSAYAGNVVLTGASGSGITATIYGSPILGSITINTTHVGLTIDEDSYPQGGITYAGGATSAQVTVRRGDMGATTPFTKTSGNFLKANGSNYVEAVLANEFFTSTFVHYVDTAGSNSNTGKQNNPYADPFFASDNNTGSASFPDVILANPGNYSASSFAIRPNMMLVSLYNPDNNGNLGNVWAVSGDITLDSSWSSAGAGSSTTLQNIKFDTSTGFDLDFASATNGVALNFVNCTIPFGIASIAGATSHIPTISFIGGRTGSNGIGLASVNCTIKNHINEGILSIIADGSGGAGTYTVDGSIIAGNVSIQGSSGNVQALSITNTKLGGSLTLTGTFCTLSIDATSIPSGGITYAGGATSAQVTPIGNAPAKSFNNAYTAQNGITPVAITSSAASVAWNLNTAPNAVHTLTENTTLANPTNPIDGYTYELLVIQHASSAKTLAFGSKFRFTGNVTPIISSVVNSRNKFSAKYNLAADVFDTDYSLDFRA